ncbi:MAG: hypothetical protein HRU46_16305 [Verrucomicrobiales bacterium]|nr:hypothetical protein [Verrucomicrobiales bacterium]
MQSFETVSRVLFAVFGGSFVLSMIVSMLSGSFWALKKLHSEEVEDFSSDQVKVAMLASVCVWMPLRPALGSLPRLVRLAFIGQRVMLLSFLCLLASIFLLLVVGVFLKFAKSAS